jgi:hypothetical protein
MICTPVIGTKIGRLLETQQTTYLLEYRKSLRCTIQRLAISGRSVFAASGDYVDYE